MGPYCEYEVQLFLFNVYSALEVIFYNEMRYINLRFTYLVYLLTYFYLFTNVFLFLSRFYVFLTFF